MKKIRPHKRDISLQISWFLSSKIGSIVSHIFHIPLGTSFFTNPFHHPQTQLRFLYLSSSTFKPLDFALSMSPTSPGYSFVSVITPITICFLFIFLLHVCMCVHNISLSTESDLTCFLCCCFHCNASSIYHNILHKVGVHIFVEWIYTLIKIVA